MLLVSGEYDNETPPKWAEQMTENLPNSFHLIFPGWKHTPTTNWSNQCAMKAANDFFNDPKTSAQDLALNPVHHKRSKHIAIKYHWVREHVDPKGELRTAMLFHVDSADQSADMYTKALTGPLFIEHRARNLGEKRRSSGAVIERAQRKRRR